MFRWILPNFLPAEPLWIPVENSNAKVLHVLDILVEFDPLMRNLFLEREYIKTF